MPQKTILMLGGSMQQVPAIEKAREMGLRTVLIDYLPDNPGQFAADKWYAESTTDIEAVMRIALAEKADGILAYASDPAALPAAIVAQKLGLPTNPPESVEILGVKHKFREFLKENGFACPENFTFSPEDKFEYVEEGIKRLSFPIVVKPTDSSGSKGVSFISDMSELRDAISHAASYSRNKILIAEEFIEHGYPYVIGGDIFVENGKIVLYGDMECLRDNNGESLIPIGKKKNNGLTTLQRNRLHTELQRIVTALDIQFGELNIELLIDKDDRPHFLELGPRAGGNMIPIQLSDAFGIDLIKANIATAMGMPTEIHPVEPDESYMTFVLHSHSDGILDSIVFDPKIETYIYRTVLYKRQGDVVERFDGAGKALGIVFMKFPTRDMMNLMERQIDKLIVVNLSEPKQLL